MHGIEKQGGNVITMSGYRREPGFRALRQVDAYWQALRRGRDMPTRSDIDPRGIEDALEYAFILERIAPGLARLRIAGAHLSDVMGMEVRGMPISAFVAPVGRRGFCETLEQVMAGPATARLTMQAEHGIGKPPLAARMLLLPLRSDFGEITRVLGCFESDGAIGRAPRRFNILGTELVEIETPARGPVPATAQPDRQNMRPAPEAAGFAEPPAPFRPRCGNRGTDAGRARHLKLVKSDD